MTRICFIGRKLDWELQTHQRGSHGGNSRDGRYEDGQLGHSQAKPSNRPEKPEKLYPDGPRCHGS